MGDRRTVTRREFFRVAGGTGAGLIVGFHLTPHGLWTATQDAPLDPNAWIQIGTDNTITVLVSESEMGQGVLTSLPMILADELEADWSQIRSEHAPADTAKYGRQSTGGSTSIRTNYDRMRRAGAAAREMLISAAAETWDVPRGACRAQRGTIVHEPTNRSLIFGAVAERAARLTPPEDPPLKDPARFDFIGTPMHRLDVAPKVDGSAVFGLDVRVPDMLVAQVAHPPVFGGALKQFDAAKTMAVPGVRHVVAIPTGVAVVADNFWAAKKGRDVLEVTWDDGGHGQLSDATITATCRQIVDGGVVARNDGDAERALANAATKLEAVYEVPYLAHAPLEPMNCTAHVSADGCELWVPTQAQTSSQQVAARIAGVSPDRVSVHTTMLGGGFGRRSQTDFVADAVHTSKAVGKPVQVVFTREDDTRAGYYRPMAYNELAAGLDGNGTPVAWVHKIASPSILEGFGIPLRDGIDGTSVEGAQNLPYAIPNLHVTYAKPDLPITTHFWRSVGSSQNAYVTECFVDELAAAAGADPVEFRLSLLADHPRHHRVLRVAAERAGWGGTLPAGWARGAAVHEAFGSFVAQIVEASLAENGGVRVHRVVCAVDCGQVINPNTVEAQMESGIVYGLSAALYGRITIERGRVIEGNFDDYPVLRMNEMPTVETHIVTSGDALGGIGEVGVPPVAPALCNALFVLTGRRIRRLPIGKVA